MKVRMTKQTMKSMATFTEMHQFFTGSPNSMQSNAVQREAGEAQDSWTRQLMDMFRPA